MATTFQGQPPRFQVQRQIGDPVAFVVVDPDGQPVPPIHAFLTHLAASGRSPYTLRAHALGLADFFRWLHTTATPLEAVTRQTIGAYITAFAQGPKGGACPVPADQRTLIDPLTRQAPTAPQRQPRTINHRLRVAWHPMDHVLGCPRSGAVEVSGPPISGHACITHATRTGDTIARAAVPWAARLAQHAWA